MANKWQINDFRFREYYRSGSRVISTPEKYLENFLMHFSTSILTLNAYYCLQKKEYAIISLL
jgi:hypothetical protein